MDDTKRDAVLSYGMETNEHNMFLELSGRMMKVAVV